MNVEQADFALTRDIAASPSIVWQVWSDPGLKRQWIAANDVGGWITTGHDMAFRVGGQERTIWEADDPGQPWHGRHENTATYLDIAPEHRIAMAYAMTMNGAVHSVVLATVLFAPAVIGTTLTYCEQITLFPGSYGVDDRQRGWARLLDTLEREIAPRASPRVS